jgi:uncharacterized protein YrrD
MIGMSVVAYDTGERLDRVTDVVFDHEQRRVLGFVIDEGGWFRSARVLPFGGVERIGTDALIARSRASIVKAEIVPEIRRVLERDNVLRNTKLMTTEGREIGTLKDIVFDEADGRLLGFEVSTGGLKALFGGRAYLPAPSSINIGDEVAFVPAADAERLGSSPDVLLGVPAAAAGETAGARGGEAGAAGVDEAPGGLDRAEADAILGRPVTRTILARDGRVILDVGEPVTAGALERARAEGAMDELLAAVDRAAPPSPTVPQSVDAAGEPAPRAEG